MPDTAELLAVLRQSGFEFDQAIHYREAEFSTCITKENRYEIRMQVLLRLLVLVFLLSGVGETGKARGGRWQLLWILSDFLHVRRI